MPRNTLSLIAGIIPPLLVWCCLAVAQDSSAPVAPQPGETAGPQPPAAQAPQVEESLPSVVYLPDEDGNLRAVLNFPFEEFERAYQWVHRIGERNRPPQYSLQRLSVTGTVTEKHATEKHATEKHATERAATEEHAELTVEVVALVPTSDWVRVPLGFDRSVLREPAQYSGPGEGFVHLEGDARQYVAWIRGQGQQHQFTLKLLAPLRVLPDETRLRLLAPRAAVSELTLTVPVAGALGEVSKGATLEPSADAGDGTTRLTVSGLGREFELAWREPGKQDAPVSAVLEAEGTIRARIDSRGVQTEARLLVRSHSEGFDRFRVRLPEHAALVPERPSGYDVIDVEPGNPDESQRQVIEVRRAKKDSSPFEIRLATSRPLDMGKPQQWFDLAGFEVVGAVQQSGHIALAVTGDWQVVWRAEHGVQRIDPLPEALRRRDVIAGFEYFAQPCSLTGRLVPRETRLSVEPQYLLLVDADQVRLEATLKYTVRGAKASLLEVVLPAGWELDAVGPDDRVAVDGVVTIEPNVLCIPLLQPSTGEMELRISAHWPIPEGATSLALPLPHPQTGLPGQAVVVVLPADNVELIPDETSTVGLMRQPIDPQVKLPRRQQAPLSYRSEAAKAVFAAEVRVHTQRVAVEVASQVTLQRQTGAVEQKFRYTVAYEPADHFTVEMPQNLAASKGLKFLFEGHAVPHATLPDTRAGQENSGTVRVRIDLPEGRIGPCELVARYPLTLKKLPPDKQIVLAVPLVMPGDGDLSRNRLLVTAAADIDVEPRDDSWTVLEPTGPRPSRPNGLELGSSQRPQQVKLALRFADERDADTTVVERAWVQTWLTQSSRQDRAVFSFTSNRGELELTIPRGAATAQIDVRLDGQSVVGKMADKQRLTVALSDEGNHRRHVLELRLHFPRFGSLKRHLAVELPQLGQNVWVRRLYWELVLPQTEHVIVAPDGFTSEFTWSWNGYFWGRNPLLDPPDLEAWAGAPSRDPTAEGGGRRVHGTANHYLFSSFGNVDRCEVHVAGRTWIVLLASGAALVAGLLLIYVPASRHPGTLLAAAVALLCVGILYPEPTLLVSQAASLGLALTLMAGLLERSVARRRRAATLPEISSAILDNGSTQVQYPPPAADRGISTQTASAAPPPLASDSNA